MFCYIHLNMQGHELFFPFLPVRLFFLLLFFTEYCMNSIQNMISCTQTWEGWEGWGLLVC